MNSPAPVWGLLAAPVLAGLTWFLHRLHLRLRHRFFRPLIRRFVLDPSLPGTDLTPRWWGDREILLELLLEAARQQKGEIQERLQALLGQPEWIEPELFDLASMRPWLRARAAERLGLFKSPRARAGLTRAFMDASPRVRKNASRALFSLDPKTAVQLIPRLFSEWTPWRAREVDEFVLSLGGAAVPALQVVIDGGRPESKVRAIRLLGTLADSSSLQVLYQCTKERDAEVRRLAGEVLNNCYNLTQR